MTVHVTHTIRRKPLSSSNQCVSRNLASFPLLPRSHGTRFTRASYNTDILSLSMPVFAGAIGEVRVSDRLASQIIKALYDDNDFVEEGKDLASALRSFQGVLILIDNALRRYASTRLSQSLTHLIWKMVGQCHISLAHFSENIDACRKAFSTTISCLWPRVVFAVSDEAGSLIMRLSTYQSKLAILLIGLNSARLKDQGSVRFCDIQAHLHVTINSLSSVRRIKDNVINVIDPLGDTLPVSMLLCRTWKEFHYVLKCYCRNRIGQAYIERGDYQLIRPQSDQVVHSPDFDQGFQEGERLEMSIILRPNIEKEERRKCPQCYRVNVPHSHDGRIQCAHCFYCLTIFEPKQRARSWKNPQLYHDAEPSKSAHSDEDYFRRTTLEVEADDYSLEHKCYMLKLERLTMPSHELMDRKTEISWDIRSDLIDFLIKIHESFSLRPETLYLAVNLVDRYSFRNAAYSIEYRLIACTALWIATKKEDVVDIAVLDLVQACDYHYSISTFVDTEFNILQSIEWKLDHPTAFLWFSRLTLWPAEYRLKCVGWFLMEFTLYFDEFIQYTPSSIALGSFLLALLLVGPSDPFEKHRKEPLQVAEALDRCLTNFKYLPYRLVQKYSSSCYADASVLVIQYYAAGRRPFAREGAIDTFT